MHSEGRSVGTAELTVRIGSPLQQIPFDIQGLRPESVVVLHAARHIGDMIFCVKGSYSLGIYIQRPLSPTMKRRLIYIILEFDISIVFKSDFFMIFAFVGKIAFVVVEPRLSNLSHFRETQRSHLTQEPVFNRLPCQTRLVAGCIPSGAANTAFHPRPFGLRDILAPQLPQIAVVISRHVLVVLSRIRNIGHPEPHLRNQSTLNRVCHITSYKVGKTNAGRPIPPAPDWRLTRSEH